MLKIVQITDCHVPGPTDGRYRGVDPRACLLDLIEAVNEWGPDLVLATGDLSEDGSEASCAWLAEAFTRIPAPVIATPGNHDDAGRLRRHFSRCAVEEPVVVERDWRIVVLNSAEPGAVPGRLAPAHLPDLPAASSADDRPTLVALHHQPWPIGSPWIDRYPLLEPEAFHQWLRDHAAVRLVLWGHVHQAVRLERGGVTGLGGPSSASNSLPGRDRFTPDPAGPACRWLELEERGDFRTGLLRPPGRGAA